MFESHACSQAFVDSLQRASKKHRFDVLAYVVMPEHVHVVAYPPEGVTTALMLKAIKLPASRAIAKVLEVEAPGKLAWMEVKKPRGGVERRIWQRGGGYDRNLWSPAVIRACIEYVHMNPVRRGLCGRPELWPWSSARSYSEPREGDWVTRYDV